MGVDDPYRRPVYTVGGMPAYGFTEPSRFYEGNVPAMSNMKAESVLYERQGWNDPTQVVKTVPGWANPPFMGIGSTSVTMAPWMSGKGSQRIIRGYMRRDTIYPIGDPNTTADLMSSNARMFFMYNPDHIQRSYQSYDQASQTLFPNNDISDLAPLSWTIVQFSLFFDRQEEVAVLENHPGVLIDLAVFDLLAQGYSPGSVNPTDLSEKVDALTKAAGVNTSDSGKSAGLANTAGTLPSTDSSSLLIDPTNMVVVIFSPNLAYRGTIMSADAVFEKFSHRMTPTRMELSITMRLYSIGQEPQINKGNGATVAAATAAAKTVGEVVPTDTQTQEEADQRNAAGRKLAMSWSEKWIAGAVTPAGVPYNADLHKRCPDPNTDDLVLVDEAHIPKFFDCSSLISRSLAVMGWSEALGINRCANSYAIRDAAKKGETSSTVGWGFNEFSRIANGNDAYQDAFLVPGAILGKDTGAGHVAWLHHIDGVGGDRSNYRYVTLEIGGTENPVHYGNPRSLSQLSSYPYQWVAVPAPNIWGPARSPT